MIVPHAHTIMWLSQLSVVIPNYSGDNNHSSLLSCHAPRPWFHPDQPLSKLAQLCRWARPTDEAARVLTCTTVCHGPYKAILHDCVQTRVG